MVQEFYINQGAQLPYLRMGLIDDGRFDFHKSHLFNAAIQNAKITFSMKDTNTDKLKVSKEPVEILRAADCGCEERFVLQYKWKQRDTKEKGIYKGWFDIEFLDDLSEDGVTFPVGTLKAPIHEDLIIYIK